MSTETELRRRVYEFADLGRYPLRKRLVIRAAGVLFWLVIGLVGRTLRWVAIDTASMDELCLAGRRFVGAFWHNRVFLATWFFRRRGIVVMTSQSFDGEYIARFIQRFGYGSARGSSTRGGIAAVLEMARLMRQGRPAAFTIDGPKGPRHVAKPGAVLLAKKTGQPILPFTITSARRWELSRSWDRFQVPKPFTRARVEIAPPIFVPRDADEDELAARNAELQAALDELDQRGLQWRQG